MSYVPRTPDEWRSEAGVFSRALRGLADRWDQALTTGATSGDLTVISSEVGDLHFEMDGALLDLEQVAEAEQRHRQAEIQRELKR